MYPMLDALNVSRLEVHEACFQAVLDQIEGNIKKSHDFERSNYIN